MKVNQLEKRFKKLQEDAKNLHTEIKPLLTKLRRLTVACNNLSYKIDEDDQLYVQTSKGIVRNGWNMNVTWSLSDFYDICEYIDSINNALYNLKNTKFKE